MVCVAYKTLKNVEVFQTDQLILLMYQFYLRRLIWRSLEYITIYLDMFNFKIMLQLIIPPETKFRGVYWIHPVRPSVCLSVRPSVRPWVGVRMITLILFSGFKKKNCIYHLGQDLAWDWISASYLIKYAHTVLQRHFPKFFTCFLINPHRQSMSGW